MSNPQCVGLQRKDPEINKSTHSDQEFETAGAVLWLTALQKITRVACQKYDQLINMPSIAISGLTVGKDSYPNKA